MARGKYREGDWFAVPLREGGFGVGLIARANPKGVLLGYFFGPREGEIPSLDQVGELAATDAVLVGTFGHLGLTQGKWPIVGRRDDWDRLAWPMPAFVRYEELTGRSFKVFYDDDDPNLLLREEQIAAGVEEHGPADGMMGAGYVEKVLTALLQ